MHIWVRKCVFALLLMRSYFFAHSDNCQQRVEKQKVINFFAAQMNLLMDFEGSIFPRKKSVPKYRMDLFSR